MRDVYVIDACALIDASKEYNMKKKYFEPMWNLFQQMIIDGKLITSIEIRDELKDEELLLWAKAQNNFFMPLTKDVQEQVVEILKKYPTLIKLTSTSNSNGDPFLIATAIVKGGCIVTNERKGDEKSLNFRIPNVCEGLNIEYMNLHQFIDEIVD